MIKLDAKYISYKLYERNTEWGECDDSHFINIKTWSGLSRDKLYYFTAAAEDWCLEQFGPPLIRYPGNGGVWHQNAHSWIFKNKADAMLFKMMITE